MSSNEALALLEQVEEVLFRLRCSGESVEWGFSPDEAKRVREGPGPDAKAEQWERWQQKLAERRCSRLKPRSAGVAEDCAELREHWPAIDRLALRYLGSGDWRWRCRGPTAGQAPRKGNPIRHMCEWGCPTCTDASFRFLAAIREKVSAEPTARNTARDGAADAILRTIRDAGDAGLNWREVAARARYSYDFVRRKGPQLERAGLLRTHATRAHAKVITNAGRERLSTVD